MRPLDQRVLPHLVSARGWLIAVVVGGGFGGVLLIGQAFAVAALISDLVGDANGWSPSATRDSWWLAGITLARALIAAIVDLSSSQAAGLISTRLRIDVLGSAMRIGAGRLSRRPSGELSLLATRGVSAIEPYVTRYLPTLVLASVLPVLTVVVIFTQDMWAGLIVVFTLPLIPIFAILIGASTQERADRQYRVLSLLAGHFLDVVRGLPTLVTYNRASAQSRKIREVTDRYRQATLNTLKLAFASSGALELVATLSVALVAVSVGLRLAGGEVGLRTALVVLLLAPEAYWPLRRVGAEFHAAAEGMATFEAVNDLLTAAVDNAPLVPESATSPDRVDPVPLEINDLVVRYDGRPTAALSLSHAQIPASGLTAIVGPSGCGKSTLLQALLGEVDFDRGTITLAGEEIDLPRWRGLVAQVPQTPWLTADSIAENLRIGAHDCEEVQLWAALTSVGLQDEIGALPDGLSTILGEDGAGLSAGQRARLALARVVVANRPYVILDEPTAHLDAATEQVMLATLVRLARHATVIVVAHRPAVVRAADHVITLERPTSSATLSEVLPREPAVASTPRAARLPSEPTVASSASVVPDHTRLRRALGTLLAILAALSGVALTATAGWLIARAAERPPVLMLMVAIIGVRTFGLARPALRYAERLVSHDVALRMLSESRARVYDVLVPLSPGRLGRHRGDLLASVVDDVDAQLDAELRVRQPILVWLGVSLVSTGLAALVFPPSAIPIGLLAFAGGGVGLAIANLGGRLSETRVVALRAALSDELSTSLQSARQLVLWQADQEAMNRAERLGRDLARAGMATTRMLVAGRSMVTAGTGLTVIITATMCATGLRAGTVSGPMAALLVLLPLALNEVLGTLPDAGVLAVRSRAASGRIESLSWIEPAVTEPTQPQFLTGTDTSLTLSEVTIGWRQPVLSGLNAQVPPNSMLGITGPSGCGKSTLAACLVRHLAPIEGRYLLGAADTSELGSAEVRRHLGLVDDNPYVFSSSLRENLRLANTRASDDDLGSALAQADLTPWVLALPQGLDTLLGDGGAGISGGERARLGIARAVLADPEVLVLDEPTAHLDSATAKSVSQTLLASRGSRTLVWITHDRAGLESLDKVWDLGSESTVAVV